MDSPSQLPDFLESCQRRIEAVLSAEIEQCDASHSLREAMAYACLGGGKRIRPVLCMAPTGRWTETWLMLILPPPL